jgi:hopene-associated glycosyltransferase HpnB
VHWNTLLAAVPLLIWIYLLFVHGSFWRLREDLDPPASLSHWPRVVAVVPARNEAAGIAACVSALARQDYPGDFSIMVVDDHSTDGTAALARKAAEEAGASGRVTIHAASDLPQGWTGKLWALNEGVSLAEAQSPQFFWFTDGDIVHAPDTLRRLVCRAERDHLDLASLMVLLRAKTLPERLLIPPFLYFFLLIYPPKWIADPNARTAGAAGGCILLGRAALHKIGGLAVIRSRVIDDCSLADAVKKTDGRIWLAVTRASVSLREYTTFAEIRDVIARTAFTQLHHSALFLAAMLVGLFLTDLLGWVELFATDNGPRLLGAAAVTLMTISFIPTVRHFRLSPLWALTLPIAAIFYAYATFVSAIRFWLGRGGQWKGRSQAQKA